MNVIWRNDFLSNELILPLELGLIFKSNLGPVDVRVQKTCSRRCLTENSRSDEERLIGNLDVYRLLSSASKRNYKVAKRNISRTMWPRTCRNVRKTNSLDVSGCLWDKAPCMCVNVQMQGSCICPNVYKTKRVHVSECFNSRHLIIMCPHVYECLDVSIFRQGSCTRLNVWR